MVAMVSFVWGFALLLFIFWSYAFNWRIIVLQNFVFCQVTSFIFNFCFLPLFMAYRILVLTRNQTHGPCSRSTEPRPLARQGIPTSLSFPSFLCWVLVAAVGLSLVAVSGSCSGCGAPASRCCSCSYCGARTVKCAGSVLVAHRFSCPAACGVFLVWHN